MRKIILMICLMCLGLNIFSQTYTGDLTLTTQSQIDAFNYKVIKGMLTIDGASISNINKLSIVDSVSKLRIQNTNITNIDSLKNLKYVGGYNSSSESTITIYNNAKLLNLNGIGNIYVYGLVTISINTCPKLINLNGLQNIKYKIPVSQIFINIANNSQLNSLHGVLPDSIKNSGGIYAYVDVSLKDNPNLTIISDLFNHFNNELYLTVKNNDRLQNLDFSSYPNISIADLYVSDNDSIQYIKLPYRYQSSSLGVVNNSALVNITGFNQCYSFVNFRDCGFRDLDFEGNPKLSEIHLFDNVTASLTLHGGLTVENNPMITNLDFSNKFDSIDGALSIINNSTLSNCCGIYYLLSNHKIRSDITIQNNPSECSSQSEVISTCPNHINQVFGRIYQDVNTNNKPDISDIFLDNIKIQGSKDGNILTHMSTDTGKYYFANDTGSYIIQPLSNFTNFATIPSSQTVSHLTYGNVDTINFKLAPTAFVNDASVVLSNNWSTRANRSGAYTVCYTNESGQTYNGTIKLKIDSRLTYQNAIPTPSFIVGDTMIWNISNLPLFTTKNIIINFSTSTSLAINDTLKSFAKIYNTQTDVTPANNQYTLTDIVRASYDPNNKEVDKNILSPAEVTQSPYLYYTVRFQNVGNDTAFDVSIKDTLDTNLDWSTFQPITSSHAYSLEQTNNKYVSFDFKDINLPDSTRNEKASHGFVFYKIKSKNNLVIGNSVLNRAAIIFDVNTPVVTNITKTAVMQVNAGRDTSICSGQSIILTATGASSYSWSNGANTSNITVSPTTTTGYIVTGTVNGISQKDTVVVNVKPLPIINIGNDRSICIGDSVTLTATTNGTSLLWNTGATTNNIIVKPITTTNYSAAATLNGCTNSDAISVEVKPLPNVSFTKVVNGIQVQLTGPNGNTNYNWSFGDATSNSTAQSPIHNYALSGKFYIVLTSTLNGCSAKKTDSVTISVTSIRNNISFVDHINIYPNPADNFITIQLNAKKSASFSISLISVDGRIVTSKEYKNTSTINDEIDLKNYSSGIYLLQIESEGEQAIYQIIKK